MSTSVTNQTPKDAIYTVSEAARVAKEALEGDYDHPDGLVRMLLTLSDECTDIRTADAITFLIDGAYANGLAFSFARDEYLKSVRAGLDPVVELRRHTDNPVNEEKE